MNLAYKLVSMVVSIVGGLLAGALFTRVWRAIAGEDEAPAPDSPDHRTSEVLIAAVLQGAITGGVRAAVKRASAKSIRSVTGPVPERV